MQTLLLLLLALAAAPLAADPAPGERFRQFTYPFRFSELDPGSKRPGIDNLRASSLHERALDLPALHGVTRAEVSIEYWGGHIGTTDQKFRINGGDWIQIPQPGGTPGKPQCYYRTLLGRATVPVPLEQLKVGRNIFQFTAGPQACYSFDWGFYWIYAFTVRLYYDSSRAYPQGEILSPGDGAVITDHPRLVARAAADHNTITRVDFVAHYEDFNWEGDGRWRQWHYLLERGQISRHIGAAFAPPYGVTWDTTWVPDQDQPVEIAAFITDNDGYTYMTPPVKVRLQRVGRSVKLYKPADVPEKFGVRVKARLTCKIPVDGDPKAARSVRLVLSTWSAAHAEEIGLNDTKLVDSVGPIHNYSFDSIAVPTALLRKGENVFYIYSSTKEHAAEVNWPGPALLVEYSVPQPAAQAPWWNPAWQQRLPIQVDAAGFERLDRPVEVDLNEESVTGSGVPSRTPLPLTDSRSLRLVEVDSQGNAVNAAVPFQFDPPATLVFLLKGSTPPAATRRFHLYFNTGSARVPEVSPPPALGLEDDVLYEGQPSYRITTPSGVYLYHKEGAGFAGLKDRDGAEWIGYRPGGRSAGEFRGIPNLGVWGHPGYSGERGSTSRVLGRGPLRISILSEHRDGQAALRWDIFPHHARMTLLRAAEPYWFLYEGTPHGKLDLEHGYLVLSTGERRPLAATWAEPLPAPEWLYFASDQSRRVLYLVNHQNDAALDQYWPMEGNMTVFGFGRQYRCCGRYMTAAPAVFTLGFVEQSAFAQVERALNSATRELLVTLGAVQSPSP